jgi:hypothetical protein
VKKLQQLLARDGVYFDNDQDNNDGDL